MRTGEESVEQIGSRAERMGLMDNSSIYLFSATRLEVPAHPFIHPEHAAHSPGHAQCVQSTCSPLIGNLPCLYL